MSNLAAYSCVFYSPGSVPVEDWEAIARSMEGTGRWDVQRLQDPTRGDWRILARGDGNAILFLFGQDNVRVIVSNQACPASPIGNDIDGPNCGRCVPEFTNF